MDCHRVLSPALSAALSTALSAAQSAAPSPAPSATRSPAVSSTRSSGTRSGGAPARRRAGSSTSSCGGTTCASAASRGARSSSRSMASAARCVDGSGWAAARPWSCCSGGPATCAATEMGLPPHHAMHTPALPRHAHARTLRRPAPRDASVTLAPRDTPAPHNTAPRTTRHRPPHHTTAPPLRWVEGKTGFPFVDCFMREIAATGYSTHCGRECACWFLVRDLGVDWRYGGMLTCGLSPSPRPVDNPPYPATHPPYLVTHPSPLLPLPLPLSLPLPLPVP